MSSVPNCNFFLSSVFYYVPCRLGVNVVEADKVSNSVVKATARKNWDEFFLDGFRAKMGWPDPRTQEERPVGHLDRRPSMMGFRSI